MLEACGLDLTLRKRTILSDLSAAFLPGAVSAIVGPNGAGKSSLLHMLAGLIRPTGGAVQLDGEPLAHASSAERARRIAFLPQSPEIAWDVDVAHLVSLGRLPWRGRSSAAADAAATDAALLRADLTDFAHRKAQRLSGGEKARVHLARMLAGQADWLLLDEPFAALDPGHVLAASRLLRQEAERGAGVVVILHDLTLAAHLADHVLLLKEGALFSAGHPRAVFTAETLAAAFDTPMSVAGTSHGGVSVMPDWDA